MTPKDFYFIQVLRNAGSSDKDLAFAILSRLLLEEENLDSLSIHETQKTFEWAMENLLSEKVMPVESWLETAFHLCKQRWDESIEWMENQPVPKILLMIDIVNRHVKEQEAAMKKASR